MSDLDPHIDAMLKAAAANRLPPMKDRPLAEVREGFRILGVGKDPDAPQMQVRDLSVDGAAGPLKARLYTPSGAPKVSAGLVFFHGGGFVIGDLDTHDALCRRLADRSEVRILSVDYRLAPEHPFPAAYEDALAATRWAFDHAAEIGFEARRIAVGGDSAGAMLAATTAIQFRDQGLGPLAFQLLLYPGVLTETPTASMQRFGEGYFLTAEDMLFFDRALFPTEQHRQDPRYWALAKAPLQGVAPMLVTTAGFDPLKDGGRLFAERARAEGVTADYLDFPSLIHGFYNMCHLSPAAARATAETGRRLGEAMGALEEV